MKRMRFYGNDFCEIEGIALDSQANFIKIFFLPSGKTLYVPRSFIQNQINYENGTTQKLILPLWFLKKSRVIGLSETAAK
jgi:hypothetical protein